jgi:hypothetical protein
MEDLFPGKKLLTDSDLKVKKILRKINYSENFSLVDWRELSTMSIEQCVTNTNGSLLQKCLES